MHAIKSIKLSIDIPEPIIKILKYIFTNILHVEVKEFLNSCDNLAQQYDYCTLIGHSSATLLMGNIAFDLPPICTKNDFCALLSLRFSSLI